MPASPWSPATRTTARSSTSSRRPASSSYETLRELATKAFHRTAHYDFVIANWFSEAEGDFPDYVMRDYEKVLELKYGENPHQRAAYYAEVGLRQHLLSQVTQLHGKQLGFNNLYDLNAARAICDEFTLPCVTSSSTTTPAAARSPRTSPPPTTRRSSAIPSAPSAA